MLLIRFVVARIEALANAFSLDFLGFGVYTFPAGEAGAMSFHDPLEGTETNNILSLRGDMVAIPAYVDQATRAADRLPQHSSGDCEQPSPAVATHTPR